MLYIRTKGIAYAAARHFFQRDVYIRIIILFQLYDTIKTGQQAGHRVIALQTNSLGTVRTGRLDGATDTLHPPHPVR